MTIKKAKKYPVPVPSSMISKISKKHPRIIITREELKKIRKRAEKNKLVSSWYKDIKNTADGLLKEPVSKYEIPDGLRLLHISRQVVNRVYTLSLVYLIENNKKYLHRIWKELVSAGNFKDWNPRHFLDTGEMMHAFAIAYDWLYHEWSGKQRKFLHKAILEKGFKPTTKAYNTHEWWTTCEMNWNFVCNCGASIAAIAVSDIYPELCDRILCEAFGNIQEALPTTLIPKS